MWGKVRQEHSPEKLRKNKYSNTRGRIGLCTQCYFIYMGHEEEGDANVF